MTDTKMPDVSEFQSGATAPNWPGIKSVNGGAGIIRVGYGNAHLDHMFVSNYTAVKANNFKFIGLYQYLRASQDVASQAQAFCNWIGPPSAVYPGTVFICDLEEGSGDQSGRANQWHSIVDHYYGLDQLPLNQRSWLYSYTSFINSCNLNGIFASQRRTWVAAYSSNEPSIGHTLWQSTDGKFGSNIVNWPGCGRCDSSISHHSLDELAAMGFGGSTVVADNQYHGEWITAGMMNLADLSAQLGYAPASVLRMTANHYGVFDPVLAAWLNAVLNGADAGTLIPAGAKIWCD